MGANARGFKFKQALKKVRNMINVEPYMLLMSLASNMNYPSQQGLIFQRVCLNQFPELNNSSHKCDNLTDNQEDSVKTVASHWNLVLNAFFYTPQLLALIVCGNLSDRFGPKRFLPIPSFLCLMATLVYLWESMYEDAPLWPYMIGNFLQGLGGGYLCSFMLGYSYMSLKSSEEKRTSNMSWGEAASNIGTFLGLLLCGPLIDNFGYKSIWVANASVYSWLILYSIIWIPGSSKRRQVFSWNSRYTRLQASDNSDSTCCHGRLELTSHLRGLQLCFGEYRNVAAAVIVTSLVYVITICDLSGVAEGVVSYLYTKDDPINLTQSEFSYFLSAKYLSASIGSILILPVCSRKFQFSDLFYATAGITARMATEVYMSVCSSKFMLFFVPVLALLSNIVSPSCRSLISKVVPHDQISSIFSIVALCECVISITASVVFSAVYPITIGWWSGFCYALIAVILLTGLFVLSVLKLKFSPDQFALESGDFSISCDMNTVDDETLDPNRGIFFD